MTTWILILFVHVGMMSDKDSNSLTTAVFASEIACNSAGEAAKKMASGTTKVIKYTCVPTGDKK
jgi:hypothetical protein